MMLDYMLCMSTRPTLTFKFSILLGVLLSKNFEILMTSFQNQDFKISKSQQKSQNTFDNNIKILFIIITSTSKYIYSNLKYHRVL
jgi:hypothetical protein